MLKQQIVSKEPWTQKIGINEVMMVQELNNRAPELMRKGILGNFRVIKNFAKSGEGSAADVEKAAKGIQAAAAKVLPLFPNGSGRPDYDDNTTRALGKIWYDWPTFKKANSAMSKHAGHVAIYAAQGNPEDVKKHFKLMGKEGCGGCHKLFRGAKVE